MNSFNLRDVLFDELDYHRSPELEDAERRVWPPRIPGVDQILSVQGVPIIYFSQLNFHDSHAIWDIYRHVWNESRAPLLFVILPDEVLIYNQYAEPAQAPDDLDSGERLLQHLEQLTDIESARQRIREHLTTYNRMYLETGAFWGTADAGHIRREHRADQRLLRGMDQVRRHLPGVPTNFIYALLGRSIFIRYLEDRGVLKPTLLQQMTDGRADSYRAALASADTAYTLFERLAERFNGDLFPLELGERDVVRENELQILARFLAGEDLDTGQLSFWPYDFTYIPKELISGIYDTFLYSEGESQNQRRRKLGAYYTPQHLVDFMVEQTLPVDVVRPGTTVLDPACGSGVYLVRAFQRLVEAWVVRHRRRPTMKQLNSLLTKHIFGVDVEREAIRVASFSLYIALLDYISNEDILDPSFRFPNLAATNLIVANFFSSEIDMAFVGKKFDRVIGNPPWGRGTLTDLSGIDAQRWLQGQQFQEFIGSKQIVQAFLLRAPGFCARDGEIALLAPVRSTILSMSDTQDRFRTLFFSTYSVRLVANFAALAHELFPESLSPAVAIFYTSKAPNSDEKIIYATPKPSVLSQKLAAIVFDATEVKHLTRQALLSQPINWKIALWGTPRDALLISRLQSLPTLLDQLKELEWTINEGYQVGSVASATQVAPWLTGMAQANESYFRTFLVDVSGIVEKKRFIRPRVPAIYEGPLALIHQSLCRAAFSQNDVAFSATISGVKAPPGQEDQLKWLVAYINSPLARYYHFLTSTRWAIERGNPLQGEYERMPFIILPADDERLREVIQHVNAINSVYEAASSQVLVDIGQLIRPHIDTLNDIVFGVFGLTTAERELVYDVVNYEIGFFEWSKRKNRYAKLVPSVQSPSASMLRDYANVFVETATALLRYTGQTLNATILRDGAPLCVAGFELVAATDRRDVEYIDDAGRLRVLLRQLDSLLLEQQTETLYMRRHVRIYDGGRFYMARPSEARFWTKSQARADADSFLTDLMVRPRQEAEVVH